MLMRLQPEQQQVQQQQQLGAQLGEQQQLGTQQVLGDQQLGSQQFGAQQLAASTAASAAAGIDGGARVVHPPGRTLEQINGGRKLASIFKPGPIFGKSPARRAEDAIPLFPLRSMESWRSSGRNAKIVTKLLKKTTDDESIT
jgi:hypothetical protein